ncbi:MAG: CRISPR system precrRNA processing endoribonuclease RAMP protein Cas6 [Anaerolineae bacterium]|nr:CRISPR system precrRNA processing endoribonuclease RAMP protein Cas6 [Anaerolineae bacterium]
MTDLASITLHLRPTHADTIPAQTGRAAQAWFLDSLRTLDSAVSAAVHDGSGQLKPFTARGLHPAPTGELMNLSPRQSYSLRVTTLHTDLTHLALNMLPIWRQGITLHDQLFAVEHIEVASTTYADLLTRQPVSPSRRLAFAFLTPTAFKRTGDLSIPLPLPEYVFGSLIDRWTRFAPAAPLHNDMRAWVMAHLSVDSHEIRTRRVSFERANKGVTVGFTGTVAYYAGNSELPFLAQLHALADYASYASIGAKTTVGLGQVERRGERA